MCSSSNLLTFEIFDSTFLTNAFIQPFQHSTFHQNQIIDDYVHHVVVKLTRRVVMDGLMMIIIMKMKNQTNLYIDVTPTVHIVVVHLTDPPPVVIRTHHSMMMGVGM